MFLDGVHDQTYAHYSKIFRIMSLIGPILNESAVVINISRTVGVIFTVFLLSLRTNFNAMFFVSMLFEGFKLNVGVIVAVFPPDLQNNFSVMPFVLMSWVSDIAGVMFAVFS